MTLRCAQGSHIERCTRRTVHGRRVHMRVHPLQERNKNIQMGTHSHIHLQVGTQILPPQLCTYMYTHSQLCTPRPYSPRCAHPRRPTAAKENRKLLPAGAGWREGPRAGEGALPRAETQAPCPPAIRPHRGCPSGAPCSALRSVRAVGALHLTLARLRSLDQDRRRMWRRLSSLAQLPGRCRRTRPQRRPAPDRRGREAGTRSRACAQPARRSGWV